MALIEPNESNEANNANNANEDNEPYKFNNRLYNGIDLKKLNDDDLKKMTITELYDLAWEFDSHNPNLLPDEIDDPRALKIFTMAMKKGHECSEHRIAILLLNGKGVKHNRVKAYKMLRECFKYGHHDAKLSLARVLIEEGVAKNFNEIVKWLKSAYEHDIEDCATLLGDVYYASKKDEEAIKWYKIGIELGEKLSLLKLADIYSYTGSLDSGDLAYKYKIISQAAKYDANMYNMLGIMLMHGHGVEINRNLAIWYFELAVLVGSGQAYVNLGNIYESGLCVKVDLITAMEHYRKAYQMGVPMAVECLDRLNVPQEVRDEKPIINIPRDFICDVCGKEAEFKCSGCLSILKIRIYCSAECQKSDWAEHKIECMHKLKKEILEQQRFYDVKYKRNGM